MPEGVILRAATLDDLAAVNDIYNHYVLTSICTAQTEPELMESRRAWFEDHDAAHPITVAERDGVVIGWASVSRYHKREGYRRTVESSVYVRHDCHRLGIGRALLVDLLSRARAIGHHTIIATIAADQAASLSLHEKLGFQTVGRLSEVEFKFGRFMDVVFMQRML